ncbi:MAG: YabP/YqfC family sporulation protein [Oscillospiraceae bacterium]
MSIRGRKVYKRAAEAVAEDLDFPIDSLFDEPVIHLTGRQRVEFECCKGITKYDDRVISIDMGDFIASVYGRQLIMQTLSRTNLVICGNITSVSLDGKEKKDENP